MKSRDNNNKNNNNENSTTTNFNHHASREPSHSSLGLRTVPSNFTPSEAHRHPSGTMQHTKVVADISLSPSESSLRKDEKAYCLLLHKTTFHEVSQVIYMTCQNGKCEYNPTLNSQPIQARTAEEIRYGRLWAEIELPKLLQERKTIIEEVKQ
jgi:hypothetical protein